MMTRKTYCCLFLAVLLLLSSAAFGVGGDIIFTPRNAGQVVFSHEHHTKFRGVKCQACHFDRFSAGKAGFQIKKELLNKREFCGHCHNGMKGFDLESQKNCSRCHKA